MLRPLRREKLPGRDLAMYILSRQGIYTHKEIGSAFEVGLTGALLRADEYLRKEGVSKKKEVEEL